MMVKPAVTDLLKIVDNRYSLVIMTAKRARQIAEGEIPMTAVDEKSPVTLAVNEIYEQKVYRIDEENNQESEQESEEQNIEENIEE